MNGAHLSHQCPLCGAPVDLEETDRIFACPFCQVRLFIHGRGPLRYYLKPRIEHEGTLIHVPYWRFRGNGFVLGPESMQHKIIDSSLLAVDNPALPASLGLRPQAMRLFFVEPDTPGSFLAPRIPSADFKRRLLAAIPGLDSIAGPKLTACVGDALSLIFLPVFQDHILIDGLTGEHLGPSSIDPDSLGPSPATLTFLSTLCPQCGWDLGGDKQSLVQTCPHCDTAWTTGANGCENITARFFPTQAQPDRYLPFWNLRFQATGFRLQTWADLIRLTNLPRVILPWMESTAFTFRVPAFKIRPELFLHLSNRVSLFQPEAAEISTLPPEPLHPVTLSREEAFHALPAVLGNLSPARKNLFPRIQGGRLVPRDATLEYIPFTDGPKEYIQPEMNMAIQKNALFWSTTL